MTYILCAPVVTQVGLVGMTPPDGIYELWCQIDRQRWGLDSGDPGGPLSTGLGEIDAACSNTFGYLTARTTQDITDDVEDFHFWSLTTINDRFDLRGHRVWTRLEVPDIAAPLAESGIQVRGVLSSDFGTPDPPSYIAGMTVRLRRNPSTGNAEVEWFVEAVDNTASGQLAAVPATSQWVGLRFSDDGETWYVERSDDCSTWDTLETFSPGVPERSLVTSSRITVFGGVDEPPPGEIVPSGSTWRIGPIFIERVHTGPATERGASICAPVLVQIGSVFDEWPVLDGVVEDWSGFDLDAWSDLVSETSALDSVFYPLGPNDTESKWGVWWNDPGYSGGAPQYAVAGSQPIGRYVFQPADPPGHSFTLPHGIAMNWRRGLLDLRGKQLFFRIEIAHRDPSIEIGNDYAFIEMQGFGANDGFYYGLDINRQGTGSISYNGQSAVDGTGSQYEPFPFPEDRNDFWLRWTHDEATGEVGLWVSIDCSEWTLLHQYVEPVPPRDVWFRMLMEPDAFGYDWQTLGPLPVVPGSIGVMYLDPWPGDPEAPPERGGLCTPVVSQVGVLGVQPEEGAWEPWCDVEGDRWTLDAASRFVFANGCSQHAGFLRWEWANPSEPEPFSAANIQTAETLDLRGRRIYLRVQPGVRDFDSWAWFLADGAGVTYSPAIDAGSVYSGEGLLFYNVSPSSVPGAGGLVSTEMNGGHRWMGLRFEADGSAVHFETSADCEVWAILATFERPEGSGPLGVAVTQAMLFADGGAAGIEPEPWLISAIYIETPGAGSEPAPES